MTESGTTQSNDSRSRPIPIPKGGFVSNADEARWLEQTILLRLHEVLSDARIKAVVTPVGLYELILMCLDSASKRRA